MNIRDYAERLRDKADELYDLADELDPPRTREPRMTPQCQTVLEHLRKRGSISGVEAASVYRIRALPRRIADLRALGYQIESELRTDETGQRYARYHLAPEFGRD